MEEKEILRNPVERERVNRGDECCTRRQMERNGKEKLQRQKEKGSGWYVCGVKGDK